MKIAPLPENESERLAALRRYEILDSEFEAAYQEVAELAATICGTPIALISLIDEQRQWFKAKIGLQVNESSRDVAFCAHAILQEGVMEVCDALADERFADNPLVTSDPHIRFYAGAPLVTADGHALGTLCTIDRRPRKLTEEQSNALRVLAQQVCSQLELRLANRRLIEQANRLEILNENRNRLFKVIAHDLKSPFQGLLSITELLDTSLEVFTPDQIRRYLGLIRNSAGATYTLLENLLQWSMLETGSLAFHPEEFAVGKLCRQALVVLHSTLDRKNHLLELSIPETLSVRADRKMFEAIVRNLVANASKFTPPGGRLCVRAEGLDRWVRLEVEDNGVGVTEEKRQALLGKADYRSSQGTEGEDGTGLGFRLVREFVGQHGGQIEIEAIPAGGTRVTFTLPAP